MAQCVDCGSKIGIITFRGYTCDDCKARVCSKCVLRKEGQDYCEKCYNREFGSRCFIATACYGYNSKEVRRLLHWRDNNLKNNSIGMIFVKSYYMTSPYIANFISDKPLAKKFVRSHLNYILKFID